VARVGAVVSGAPRATRKGLSGFPPSPQRATSRRARGAGTSRAGSFTRAGAGGVAAAPFVAVAAAPGAEALPRPHGKARTAWPSDVVDAVTTIERVALRPWAGTRTTDSPVRALSKRPAYS
jgi:hypothetical protein